MGTLKGTYLSATLLLGVSAASQPLHVSISEISLQPLLHLHSDNRAYLRLVTAGHGWLTPGANFFHNPLIVVRCLELTAVTCKVQLIEVQTAAACNQLDVVS